MLAKVSSPFLKLVLNGCVALSKGNNCTLITEKEMAIINDKRSKEKKKIAISINYEKIEKMY